MEPNHSASLNKQRGFLSRKFLWIVVIVVVIVCLIASGVLLYLYRNNIRFGRPVDLAQTQPIEKFESIPANLEIDPTKPIAVVGKETLYGEDFNYILSNFFRDEAKGSTVSADLKQKVLTQAVWDSVILQLARDQKLISNQQLSPEQKYFSSTGKNMDYRQSMINQATEALTLNQKVTNGEFISLWFHNNTDPQIPLADAEKQAKAFMDDLRSRITSGKLTFEQAAEEIRNKSDWAKVDPMYKQNAYAKFSMPAGRPAFVYHDINNAIANLKTGQVSPVIRVPAKEPLGSVGEEFYALVKANEIVNPGSNSLPEQIDKFKAGANVKFLI